MDGIGGRGCGADLSPAPGAAAAAAGVGRGVESSGAAPAGLRLSGLTYRFNSQTFLGLNPPHYLMRDVVLSAKCTWTFTTNSWVPSMAVRDPVESLNSRLSTTAAEKKSFYSFIELKYK